MRIQIKGEYYRDVSYSVVLRYRHFDTINTEFTGLLANWADKLLSPSINLFRFFYFKLFPMRAPKSSKSRVCIKNKPISRLYLTV